MDIEEQYYIEGDIEERLREGIDDVLLDELERGTYLYKVDPFDKKVEEQLKHDLQFYVKMDIEEQYQIEKEKYYIEMDIEERSRDRIGEELLEELVRSLYFYENDHFDKDMEERFEYDLRFYEEMEEQQ